MNTANAAPRSVKSSLKGGPEDNSLLTVVKNSKTETEEPQPQKPAEEKRLGAFHRAQPRKFDVLWGRATSQRFFVLKRERCDAESCPQEDFELAGTTGNVYSIKIARQPQCNCPHGLKGHRTTTYTNHVALLSSELKEIYSKLPQSGSDVDDPDADSKNRKVVDGECAICYMDLDKVSSKSIVWCRATCGHNFYKVCFDTWSRACGTLKLTCPQCRSPWETEDRDAGAITVVNKAQAVDSVDGYVNVARLSRHIDYSTYSPYSSWLDQRYRYQNWLRRL
ncbi:hypothetical protein NQ176_g10479 [Zarea fungicola]|uniref:Uncharacterized protein n=1 Tax=Zarea fungicola TaxID=93591 RepID=A0ACC1MFH6_9HYPO|nr:hypothetical protein NQ176_g10479 [Lecanicillium fungicola]